MHTGRPQAQILPADHLLIPCSMLDRIKLCTSVHVHISCVNAHVGVPSLETCSIAHTHVHQTHKKINVSEFTVCHIQKHRDRTYMGTGRNKLSSWPCKNSNEIHSAREFWRVFPTISSLHAHPLNYE